MYLGPTIPGVARHSTVFKNGVLPKKVEECIKELPVMQRLFIPLSQLPEAMKEMNNSKSVLCRIYRQTAQKFTNRR